MRDAIDTLSLSTVRARTDVLLASCAVVDPVVAGVALLAFPCAMREAIGTLKSLSTVRTRTDVLLSSGCLIA